MKVSGPHYILPDLKATTTTWLLALLLLTLQAVIIFKVLNNGALTERLWKYLKDQVYVYPKFKNMGD